MKSILSDMLFCILSILEKILFEKPGMPLSFNGRSLNPYPLPYSLTFNLGGIFPVFLIISSVSLIFLVANTIAL